MNKKLLLQELHQLVVLWNKADYPKDEPILERMEHLLINFLEDHGDDVDILIKLALVEFTVPWIDGTRSSYYLNRALSVSPNNVQALLLLAEIQTSSIGMQKQVLDQLKSIKTTNEQDQALVYYAQSLYYLFNHPNSSEHEVTLIKSIEMFSGYVRPQLNLGDVYARKGEKLKACRLFESALKNIKQVLTGNELADIADPERYIDIYLKGMMISDILYDSILARIAECQSVLLSKGYRKNNH